MAAVPAGIARIECDEEEDCSIDVTLRRVVLVGIDHPVVIIRIRGGSYAKPLAA